MEFFDEDARPRFLFQSRTLNPPPVCSPQCVDRLNKPFLFATTSISALFISLALFYLQSEPFKSLLLWAALSLLVGPFAPSSLTGGDIRVGQGPVVQFPERLPEPETEGRKKPYVKRPKAAPVDEGILNSVSAKESEKSDDKIAAQTKSDARNVINQEEQKDWSENDIDILRKQLVKHPAGKPRRWEIIAEAFNGRHRVDGVIKKAKELADKKMNDKDSYAQFLKNRKPLDKRIDGTEDAANDSEVKQESEWSSGDDLALLNALKAFPKDVPMRWEKVAAAVPGKTKAACMKRVTELKRDFRSSKAAKE
ncbi:hypothetical protein SAY87_000029 [Trapa incisa]|uniref:Myb-like domain-containing protein n=1 Tax=Trapa incisa TaxID=236973 RepID=A0AAN7JGV2_9MYRT|nr:hypothetical protein SAY87_000029 [Trapa incisa]